ncbi:hypothetical protein [Shimia aestuarii]|uniref:Uncharacterized protein n=1 Tax=Shimia aestuarii TaxID=254406 RepID=A0A1I4RX40_9RHOB|nr:hypothetical protein [Shimia aestuarii]SFM56846.1 hypothetical protein SAMN04488042_10934 [Shimia aestuarii]
MTRPLILAVAIAAIAIPFMPSKSDAGILSRACMRSDRKAATRPMCNCIQQVANQNLSRADQRLAASFFSDPHKAQEIRQSDTRGHEQFWSRYKEFGTVVAASCGHLR